MPARHLAPGRLAALAGLFCLAAAGCAAGTPAGLPGTKTTEHLTITDIGPAPVTVPAGSYQATLLEQTVTASAGSQTAVKTWIVNGIGQVKTQTTVIVEGKPFASSVQTLTTFTMG